MIRDKPGRYDVFKEEVEVVQRVRRSTAIPKPLATIRMFSQSSMGMLFP